MNITVELSARVNNSSCWNGKWYTWLWFHWKLIKHWSMSRDSCELWRDPNKKNQVTLMFLLFNSAKVLILTYSDCFDSSTDVRWHSWPSSQSPDSNRTSAISRIAICGWCHELHWVHCDCMITVRGHRCEHWTVNHNNSPLLWLPGQQKGATDEDWDVCRQASYGLNQS